MKKRRAPTAADEEEEVVYFGRLPDDVIIDIFGRVNDSKFLIQCLLLSKRIASLIRLVTSVSIKIHLPHVEHNPAAAIQGYCRSSSVSLRSKLISPSSQDVDFASFLKLIKWPYSFDDHSFDELERLYMCKARDALHPFSKVQSAIVGYTKFNSHYLLDTKKMRWMVEYSGGGEGGVIKSCAFLGLLDHHTAKGFHSQDGKRIVSWVASLIQTLFTFYPMVAQMAQDHESLGDILVTAGSARNGWIHAGEDEIVKMRQAGGGTTADKLNKMLMDEIHMMAKVWYVPVPKKDTVFAFVVVSGPDNIDQEVKAATMRFWGDCSYWAGQDDEVIQQGIERNMRELVETIPCNFECNWITDLEKNSKEIAEI